MTRKRKRIRSEDEESLLRNVKVAYACPVPWTPINYNTTVQPAQWPSTRERTANLRPPLACETKDSRMADGGVYHSANRNVADSFKANKLHFLTLEYRGYDPIARQMQEQSWTVYNPRRPRTSGSRIPSRQSNKNYQVYRGPGSGVDSQVLPSDDSSRGRNYQWSRNVTPADMIPK
jgi:hypothetical protein